jgi:hypothetical protein
LWEFPEEGAQLCVGRVDNAAAAPAGEAATTLVEMIDTHKGDPPGAAALLGPGDDEEESGVERAFSMAVSRVFSASGPSTP